MISLFSLFSLCSSRSFSILSVVLSFRHLWMRLTQTCAVAGVQRRHAQSPSRHSPSSSATPTSATPTLSLLSTTTTTGSIENSFLVGLLPLFPRFSPHALTFPHCHCRIHPRLPYNPSCRSPAYGWCGRAWRLGWPWRWTNTSSLALLLTSGFFWLFYFISILRASPFFFFFFFFLILWAQIPVSLKLQPLPGEYVVPGQLY